MALSARTSPSVRLSYIQGELGDCYLLGAMSSIAAAAHKGERGALLKRLIKTGSAELGLGFVTFEMYSFGEWVETTVDTLLPCNESGALTLTLTLTLTLATLLSCDESDAHPGPRRTLAPTLSLSQSHSPRPSPSPVT